MAQENQQSTPLAQLLYETHAAFRYVVEIAGLTVGAFTECTLPVMELEVEDLREGGVNTYTHLLPGRRKSARLTLKNGVGKNGLMDWCIATMQEKIEPKEITVTLKDARAKEPICIWHIQRAYPVKWTGPQLQAGASAIAIQTIEFACGLVTVEANATIID